jgi:hypothetical protein
MSTHSHSHAHTFAPSGNATVVLDIGDGIGALIVHTPLELAGTEIDIARRGETRPFVHTAVRERRVPTGTVYAAVFASLPEGRYTLPDAPNDNDVVIVGGHVTETNW